MYAAENGHLSDSSTDHEDELADHVSSLPRANNKRSSASRTTPFSNGNSTFERVSQVVDLETGRRGGYRSQQAVLRSELSMHPTRQQTRRRRHAERRINGLWDNGEASDVGSVSMHGRLRVQEMTMNGVHSNSSIAHRTQHQQYRLSTVKARSRWSRFGDMIGISDNQHLTHNDATGSNAGCCFIFAAPEAMVRNFLFWSLRTHIVAVFLAAVVIFMFVSHLFAVGIFIAWSRNPHCVVGSDSQWYIEAWYLSYQTFTTLGYGVISAVSSKEPGVPSCIGLSILTSLEGYCGLVFASMYAAIMIVKVSRIQSHAPIEFSGPIACRYGHNEMSEASKNMRRDLDSESLKYMNIPCPVMEIRLVNLMGLVPGGELIDCSVNVFAVIDKQQAPQVVKDAVKGRHHKERKRIRARSTSAIERSFNGTSHYGSWTDKPRPVTERMASFEMLDESIQLPPQTTFEVFEEDDSGYLLPKRIFSKLDVESPKHPFFNRSWVLRHVVNEFSPLLNNSAREAVRKNKGFWPRELNNFHGVRDAITFDHVLVNFSGTSNAGGNSVYTQKIYDKSDLFVGYQHVSVLYSTSEGNVAVDYTLNHDIIEQNIGDGEPLDNDRESERSADHIMVL